ncbi:MAG: thrombospondin type 3 repeat-containing protein [Myxococcota bacterium]
MGPDDRVHAVFDPGPGDRFGHAIRDPSGEWTIDEAATNARWMGLQVADDGVVHGTYSNGSLRYGSTATGDWLFETVSATGIFAERNPLMVFEGAATPAIGFVDYPTSSVALARKDGEVWAVETVSDNGVGPLGSIRDDGGTLHAVFRREDEDRRTRWVHANDASGTWSDEALLFTGAPGVGGGSPLDVAIIDDTLLWADAQGGIRLILDAEGGPRTYVAALDDPTVRMQVVGTRLLLLAIEATSVVHFLDPSLTDADDDGVRAAFDVCPDVADPDQEDRDGDGVGDACNEAEDGDGDDVADVLDNCPTAANPEQANADRVEELAPLDLESGRSFEVEPGATLTFDAAAFVASGAELACGPCDEADFSAGLTRFELNEHFCGEWWRDHLGDSTFCVRAMASDVRFDFEVRSILDAEYSDCVDADFGASCNAAEGLTSARFWQDDEVGDACDCDTDGRCTAWADGEGYCDGSTPDRLDEDCDYTVVEPDPAEDAGAQADQGCACTSRGSVPWLPAAWGSLLLLGLLRRRS